MPPNIVTTPDIQVRARMRKLLSTSFNAQSLLDQASTREKYADVVIGRLLEIHYEKNSRKEETVMNMLDWITNYTIDVMSDASIGELFHCLDHSSYHPWIETLHMFFRGMIMAAAVEFFPRGRSLLQTLVPRDLREQHRLHIKFMNNKIRQRIELKRDRSDFISPFLREMDMSAEKMTMSEIQFTFGELFIVVSEATATTLVGYLYRLGSDSMVQEQL